MLFYCHDTSDDELFDNCAKNYEWIISKIELEQELGRRKEGRKEGRKDDYIRRKIENIGRQPKSKGRVR